MNRLFVFIPVLCCTLLLCGFSGFSSNPSRPEGARANTISESDDDISWIYGSWRYTTSDGIRQVVTINPNRSVHYAMYDFTGQTRTAYNSGLIAQNVYNSFSVSSIGGEDVLFIGNKGEKVAISLYVDKQRHRLLTWGTKEPMERENTSPLGGVIHESKVEFMKDVNSTKDYLKSTTFKEGKYGEPLGLLYFADDGVYLLVSQRVKGSDGKKHKIGNSFTVRKSTDAYSSIDITGLSGEKIVLTLFAKNSAYHNNDIHIYADLRDNDVDVLERYPILVKFFFPCDESEEESLQHISTSLSYGEMDINDLLARANKEDERAQNELGYRFEKGVGVPVNHSEAVKWYRKSAEQGNAAAQNNYANYLYAGKGGVPQDYTEAAKWFRKSAEQGNPQGQNGLGTCYRTGKGVPQNYSEAAKWYRKSAEQGNPQGQNNLGWCYKEGKGVTQDYKEAVKWYRKSAEQGYASGQYNLGWCYYNGKGVPEDIAEAKKWISKAAKQGNETAKRALKVL